MTYYAGLDVSLEETAVCVVDDAGRIVKELRAASEPQALVDALQTLGLPLERVGLEACSLAAWLHDALCQAGLPAICIETRQANAAMRTMPNKTDRNDARALAQIMRTGWFRQVHVKSRSCRLWRSLLVARRTVLHAPRGEAVWSGRRRLVNGQPHADDPDTGCPGHGGRLTSAEGCHPIKAVSIPP